MNIKKATIGSLVLGGLAGLIRIVQYFTVIDREGYLSATPFSKGLQIGLVAVLLLGLGLAWLCCHGKKTAPLTGNEGKWISFPVRQLFLVLAMVAILDLVLVFLKSGPLSVEAIFYLLGALGWFVLALGDPKGNLWGLLTMLHSGACVVVYFWNT